MNDSTDGRFDIFSLLVKDLLEREGRGFFFFVQIGAHDGVTGDVLHPFVVEHHLRGLLVEPQPKIFQKLIRNYAAEPQLDFEQAAICEAVFIDGGAGDAWPKSATLHAFKSEDLPEHATMLASFDRQAVAKNWHGYQGEIEELTVPALTFSELLQKHGGIKRISLLQIDTEGCDFEILKMMAAGTVRPQLIRFESAFLRAHEWPELCTLLTRSGYQFTTTGIDTVAWIK